jgi:hypothetical protein
MIKDENMKLKISTYAVLIAAVLAQACTNISEQKNLTTTNNPSTIGSSTLTYSHVVKNATVTALTDGSGNLEMSLTTDTSLAAYQPLTQFCAVSGTTNPCVCELKWTEVNTVGGNATSFDRTKRAPLTTVQSGLVKCKFTSSFWGEIPDGTTLRINIVAVSPNISGLNAKSIGFKKGSSTTPNGDFVDDTLTPFRNIYRYTCSSRRTNTYEILNQYTPTTAGSGTNPPTYNVLLGSRFCTGATPDGASCAAPRSGFSAQNYYRNLFVRSDKLGTINSKNNFYECPKVDESISYSAGQTIPSAEKQKYWPLDTTFALATTYSSDWSIPVRAGSLLYKSGDSNSTPETCNAAVDSDDTRYLNETGVVSAKCLGYAKKPKVDGTCGSITDNNGRVRPLVRLRRYRAIFPPTFAFNGAAEARSAYADEVYIADRLVVDSSGVPTGNMIFGPKPCNYAWFDHEGVTNEGQIDRYGETGIDFKTNFRAMSGYPSSFPSYVSTSKYQYDDGLGTVFSVNPDGRVLPNVDRDGTVGGLTGPSCSATVSVVDEVMGVPATVRLITANERNTLSITLGTRKIYMRELHISPVDPWTPNYVEDTSFQGCAPVADPYLEPPLHFYKKDANTMAWCAKVYPTQNPYWADLNSKKRFTSAVLTAKLVNYPTAAKVRGFTSHPDTNGSLVVATPATLDDYNKCSSTGFDKICAASVGASSGANYTDCLNYLTNGSDLHGAFGHTNTCDRTVSYDASADFRGFPIQAKDADVESMLSNDLDHDRTYSCQYSVNVDSTKVKHRIPASGCCGVVNGNAILKSLINGAPGSAGHLEPLLNSAVPNIRFCGNPVE